MINNNDQPDVVKEISSEEFISEDFESSSSVDEQNNKKNRIYEEKFKEDEQFDDVAYQNYLSKPQGLSSQKHNALLKLKTQNDKMLTRKMENILRQDLEGFQNSQQDNQYHVQKIRPQESNNNQDKSDFNDLSSSIKPVTFNPKAIGQTYTKSNQGTKMFHLRSNFGAENSMQNQNSQRASQLMSNENNDNKNLCYSFKKQSTLKSKGIGSSRYDDAVSEKEEIIENSQHDNQQIQQARGTHHNRRESLQKVRPNIKANQINISNKYTARVLDGIQDIIYEDNAEQIQGSTLQQQYPHEESPFEISRKYTNENIPQCTQQQIWSPTMNIDQLQNQQKQNKQLTNKIQKQQFNLINQNMAGRGEGHSKMQQQNGVDEKMLYSNENINKLKQSKDFKKSIQQLSLDSGNLRKKKFDQSQCSNWIGSSNSNITIQNSKQNRRGSDRKKYEKKAVIHQESEQSSERSDDSAGSQVKYGESKDLRQSKRWGQRKHSNRDDTCDGNQELQINKQIRKQATVRIKQPNKKIQINKKYTNDFENEGNQSDDGISLTLNELSSLIENSNQEFNSKKLSKLIKNKGSNLEDSKNNQQTSSQRTLSKQNQNKTSRSRDKSNLKGSINHIGQIGEGLERSNSKNMGEMDISQNIMESISSNTAKNMKNNYSKNKIPQQIGTNIHINKMSNSENEYQFESGFINYENEPIIDVVGQGVLNEVYQQRGDEDSRRYRVFQHYLRNSLTSKKYSFANKIPRKDKDQENYSWESSSSEQGDVEKDIQGSSTGKISHMKKFFSGLIKQQSPNKQANKNAEINKRDVLIRRKNMRQNLQIQKQQLKLYRNRQQKAGMSDHKDREETDEMLSKMLSLNSNFNKIERKEDDESQAFMKVKKSQKLQPLMIQGSDEDQFYDQTIQLLSQDQDNKKDILLFDPDSQGKAAWEVIGLFFIIYQSIIIPYRLCFEVIAKDGWYYIETAIDICFILDIFVQFNSGFYSKGNLIMQRSKIVSNYVRNWFFIDVVASFPYSWLVSDEDLDKESLEVPADNTLARTPQLLKMLKLARFLRFLRLLRVFKLKQILYRIEELIMNDALVAIINLFKVICVVLFIGHWIACLFYAIGASEYESVYDCWLTNADLQDTQVDEKYIASLYWAFATMTTVGYGDIYPITITEKLFAMLSMLIACAVFAYVVGSIETIVRRSNTIENVFKERILHVNQYLVHQNIPKPLRMQVRRYLEQMQEHKKREKLSQSEVVEMLNVNLRDEVLIHIVGKMLRQNRIFVRLFDERLQSEMIFMLKQKMFLMDDHIFEEGDKQDGFLETVVFETQDQQDKIIESLEQKKSYKYKDIDIYKDKGQGLFFIIQGQIILLQKKTKTYITDLNVESVFGEISFFSGRPRTLTARSRGFSELMYLNQAKFLSQIHLKHPHTIKKYEDIRKRLTDDPDNFKPLFIKCYRCGEKGHIATKCILFDDWKGNLLKKDIFKIDENIINKDAKENQKLKDTYMKFLNPGNRDNQHDEHGFSDSSENSIETNTEIKSSDYMTDSKDNEGPDYANEFMDGEEGKVQGQMFNDNSTRQSKNSKSKQAKQSRSDEKDSFQSSITNKNKSVNKRGGANGVYNDNYAKLSAQPDGSFYSRQTQKLDKVKEFEIEDDNSQDEKTENHANTGKQKYKSSNILGPSVQFQTASDAGTSYKGTTPPPGLIGSDKQKSELNFTNLYNARAQYSIHSESLSHQRIPTQNSKFSNLDQPRSQNHQEEVKQAQKPTLQKYNSQKQQEDKIYESQDIVQKLQKRQTGQIIQGTDSLYNSKGENDFQVQEVNISQVQDPHQGRQKILKKQETLEVPKSSKKRRLEFKQDDNQPSHQEYKPRSNQLKRRVSIDITPLGSSDNEQYRARIESLEKITEAKQQRQEESKISKNKPLKGKNGELKQNKNNENSKKIPSIRRTAEQNMYYNKQLPKRSQSSNSGQQR